MSVNIFIKLKIFLQINPNVKAPEQNLKPGTIIDTAAVHPEFAEFFLTSHRALQVWIFLFLNINFIV